MAHPAKDTPGGIRVLDSLIPESSAELYYAVVAVHFYNDTADEANARKALIKLGRLIAKQDGDLAAEAAETVKALTDPDFRAAIPEPVAVCRLLETQPAPSLDDIRAMNRFFRLKILKIPMDQEDDAIIVVEGPLERAFRTLSGLDSAQ